MRAGILGLLLVAAMLAASAELDVLVMNGRIYVPGQSLIEAMGGKVWVWPSDDMPTFVMSERDLPLPDRGDVVMRNKVAYVSVSKLIAICPLDFSWDGAAGKLTVRNPKTDKTLVLPQGEVLTFPLSSIHDVAQQGDIDRLRQLIKDLPNRVNTTDPQQRTPLHWAAALGRLEAVQVLLENKAPADALALGRVTPLQEAVKMGQTAVVKALIAAGANINQQTLDGSLLHIAVTNPGNLEVVKLLVEKDLDVNMTSGGRAGRTPLLNAAGACHADIISLLIEHGADIKKPGSGITPLQWAAFAGNADAVRVLLEAGAPVNGHAEDNRTPLKMAMDGAKDPDVLNLLRQHGGTEQ